MSLKKRKDRYYYIIVLRSQTLVLIRLTVRGIYGLESEATL